MQTPEGSSSLGRNGPVQYSLSIIMPALNEEANILAAIKNSLDAIDDFGITGELICVNDGSSDNTLSIIEEMADKDQRIRIISHETSHGFGASFWDGVSEARMDIIVVMPGDNENNPWEILQYIRLLEHVDIVIPFVYNLRARSIFRVILSSIYRLIVNTTFRTNLNYTNGTVLYRASLLKSLSFHSSSFFFQTDILIRLIKNRYLFAEVPYRLEQTSRNVSKAISFPSLIQVVTGYLRLLNDQYKNTGKFQHVESSASAKRYGQEKTKMLG